MPALLLNTSASNADQARQRNEIFCYWCEIGRRMGIKDIPDSYEAYERFNLDFEREQFRYSPDNEAIAVATRNLVLSWVLPKWLWR